MTQRSWYFPFWRRPAHYLTGGSRAPPVRIHLRVWAGRACQSHFERALALIATRCLSAQTPLLKVMTDQLQKRRCTRMSSRWIADREPVCSAAAESERQLRRFEIHVSRELRWSSWGIFSQPCFLWAVQVRLRSSRLYGGRAPLLLGSLLPVSVLW